VYGLFGLAVLVLTACSLAGALVALARHRLHPNRWWRAVRFATPGIGAGAVVVFTLGVLRVLAPQPTTAVPLVLVGAAVGFVAGYLTPGPDRDVTTADAESAARVTLPPVVAVDGP
jgi:hypothetical protein